LCLVVGSEEPVHVIGVEMRDHHQIDGVAVDAGRGEVVLQPPAFALALREHRLAIAGVDQHALAAGRQHDRRIGVAHVIGRQSRGLERGGELVLAGIANVAVGRGDAEAVGQHRHGDVADAVAMDLGSHGSRLQMCAGRPAGGYSGAPTTQLRRLARAQPE
jgi:hypothetical protein